MKTSPKLPLFFLAISFLTLASFSAKAVDENGTARITIATPITIDVGNEMNFGVIAPSSTATGTVSTATGAVSNGLTHLSGNIQPGTFIVHGQVNSPYNLTVDPSVVLSSGSNSMSATLAHSSSANFDGNGDNEVTVDGVLTIGINQAAGEYVGTYKITANY